jgi:beta-1,4-mannosyl-glycoprotein beta-1,4-N-acetylglucosaminyltransferase
MFNTKVLRRLISSSKRRRRVDACLLHNEIDLLTLRIEELWDQIDYFVVVEATETFSGLPKPLFFHEHRSRFQVYSEKLVYHSISGLPPISEQSEPARFAREAVQRNAINQAVASLPLSPKDIVLVCDVDEIPRACRLEKLERTLSRYDYVIFMLRNHRGYINNRSDTALNGATIAGPVACRVATLQRVGAHQVRRGGEKSGGVLEHRSRRYHYIDDAGWHFSSLGGPEAVWLKAVSFSHVEDPYRVIRIGNTAPEQQVFRADLDREACRDHQKQYVEYCHTPAFSSLTFDAFNAPLDLPAFLLREKERFRSFFFFTDLS